MSDSRAPLAPLFTPRSIAVVGASDDPKKLGFAMMAALTDFEGPVFPVNPRGGNIAGRDAAMSLTEIGEPVDLAMLAVPPDAVPDVLEQCGMAGIGAAVICAGGFAETGDPARADLQARTLERARAHGVRVLGPNTSGFVNCVDRVNGTFLPDVGTLAPGPLAVVAQSGGVNLVLSFLAAASGLGLRLGVGLGNAIDVGFADVLDFLADDDATEVVGMHIEGVGDGQALVAAVRRVAAKKPVIAYKVGRSDVTAFAASHTGSMIGNFELARAALAQAGAVVVDDLDELIEAARALAVVPRLHAADPGVGFVTGQAGPGLIVADALRSRGVTLPVLAPAAIDLLHELLPPITFQANPVDTGRPGSGFADVVATVAGDPSVDLLACFLLEEPDAVDPVPALEPIARSGVPVLFGSGGPADAVERRARQFKPVGVPLFGAPERLASAIRAVVHDGRARYRRQAGRAIDCERVHEPIDATLDEDHAKQVFDQLGIATLGRRVCNGRAEAIAALHELGAPVVLKILDASITHKAAVGGVRVGLNDEPQLLAALDGFAHAGLNADRVLIEQQAPDGFDLIVGAVRDAAFGPTVVLGLGGAFAELVPPAAMRVVPLTDLDLAEMVASLPSMVLEGGHGLAPVDAAQLAYILASLGAFLVDQPLVMSAEVNPLRVTSKGAVALDALVLTRKHWAARQSSTLL